MRKASKAISTAETALQLADKAERGDTHAAFYFFARRNGKLVKTYVRKAEVEAFTVLVKLAAAERKQRRESARASVSLLRRLRESALELEQIKHLYKQNYE